MSTNFFRKISSARATRASLEDDKSRTGLPQDINQALVTSPPIGAMTEWGGDSDPPGGIWIIADGRALEQATYPDLFAAYGAKWNTGGETATQFRIPDRRGRVGVGAKQGTGLTNRILASTFGEENHTLASSEIPAVTTNSDAHDHIAFDPGRPGNAAGVTNVVGHNHQYTYTDKSPVANVASGSAISVMTGVSHPLANTANTDHGHYVDSLNSDSHSHVLNGGGGSHNNMQPSIAVNFIVRVL